MMNEHQNRRHHLILSFIKRELQGPETNIDEWQPTGSFDISNSYFFFLTSRHVRDPTGDNFEEIYAILVRQRCQYILENLPLVRIYTVKAHVLNELLDADHVRACNSCLQIEWV